MKKIDEYIRSIVDFPEEGIIFRDVTSVLEHPESLKLSIDLMQKTLDGLEFDVIAGAESRGFIFGMPLAYNLNKAFVPVRKKGKLPCDTEEVEYSLEYGTATIEIHKTAFKPGAKVIVVDDLMATGGTTKAMIDLIEKLGGEVVKVIVLIELAGLEGRKLLEGYDVESIICYPGK